MTHKPPGSGSETKVLHCFGLQSCVAHRPWFIVGRVRSSMVQHLHRDF